MSNFLIEDGVLVSYTGESEHVVIPSEVRVIGEDAFYFNLSLKSVRIEGELDAIERNAFYSCNDLERVEALFGIGEIGYGAFGMCLNLRSVSVKGGVGYIEDGAFFETISLEELEILGEETNYKTVNGGVYTADGKMLVFYPSARQGAEVEIAYGTEIIGIDVFARNDKIKSLKIPPTVRKICDGAFFGMSGLKSLEIPEGVCEFEQRALLFLSLDTISVSENNQHFKTVDGALYSKDQKTLVLYPTARGDSEVVIADGTEEIACGALTGVDTVKSIKIPSSVRVIRERSFTELRGLPFIEIPEGVCEIEERAFSACTSLEGVLLPSTVTKIDMEAFYDCADPFVIFGKKGTYAERYAKALKKHDRSIRVVFEAI